MHWRGILVLLVGLIGVFGITLGLACGSGSDHDRVSMGDDDTDGNGPPDSDDDNADDDDDDDVSPPSEEVLIPAGPFFMGEEPEYLYGYDDERPRHEVQMSAYYIDIDEVTNAEFLAFLAENPDNLCDDVPCGCDVHATHEMAGIYLDGTEWKVDYGFENRPANCVSWHGAKAYCEWVGGTLPTEAQWEKAAKGADEHFVYPWGEEWRTLSSNWWDNGDPWEDGQWPTTTPGCTFDGTQYEGGYQTEDGRSPYGVCDLAGNVWEWVADWYSEDYYKNEPEGDWVDPQGPTDGTAKGRRGGSWFDERWYALMYHSTTHRRGHRHPDGLDAFTGFRCARSAE
jgi:formylglycine-generating enzyme required for sulfatase activity